MGHLLGEHPRAFGVGIVHHQIALVVVDLVDRLRIVVDAAVCQGGVGVGHLQHSDVLLAQSQRRVGAQIGGDAHLLGRGQHLRPTDSLLQADEAGVGRHGEGPLDAAVAVVDVVDVLQRLIVLVLRLGDVGRRGAVHDGLGADPLLQRSHQREGLE